MWQFTLGLVLGFVLGGGAYFVLDYAKKHITLVK
jgi:hypothetical protein